MVGINNMGGFFKNFWNCFVVLRKWSVVQQRSVFDTFYAFIYLLHSEGLFYIVFSVAGVGFLAHKLAKGKNYRPLLVLAWITVPFPYCTAVSGTC